MVSHHDPELLTRIASELQAGPGEEITTLTIVRRAVDLLPGVDHCSLTVRGRRHTLRTLASTSELATQLDRLQYELGEGPCLDSADGVEWSRSGDLRNDQRWPHWGPPAADAGAGSILCVRLMSQDQPMGAINMYSSTSGMFSDPDDVEVAILYGALAANALAAARLVSGLETAIGSRHNIGMAQGMLMERFGLSEDQSFALLQRLSSELNRKLRDVARDIVSTREMPSFDGDGGAVLDGVSAGD